MPYDNAIARVPDSDADIAAPTVPDDRVNAADQNMKFKQARTG